MQILIKEIITKNPEILLSELDHIQKKYPKKLDVFNGKGLVAAIQCVTPGTKDPDLITAVKINISALQKVY